MKKCFLIFCISIRRRLIVYIWTKMAALILQILITFLYNMYANINKLITMKLYTFLEYRTEPNRIQSNFFNILMFFRDRFDRIRTLSVLIKLKLIKIKKKFDGLTIFLDFQKKWPFLATFDKIALSQPKRIQIKKNRSR